MSGMFPLRAASTGDMRGPLLADALALLGVEACRRRVNRQLERL